MGKKIGKIAIIVIIVLAVILGIMYLIDRNRMKNNEPVLFSTWGRKYQEPQKTKQIYNENENIKIILSLEDEITNNSAWCGTFNLIWNDLKNDLAKQDIVFTPQLDVVKNLNKGTFNTSYLSEESYYKVYGTPSLELKKQIEKAIKDKFNETSDILDDFDWENHDPKDYFLYAMLKKEFEFPKVFTELENGKFGNYDNVKYFGIDSETDDEVRNQVKALYYNSEDDFAIKLTTKSNDEVVIARGIKANTFGKAYEEIKEKNKKESYTSLYEPQIGSAEEVKIPNISFNLKEEFEELENKYFDFSNGDTYKIDKALQTIQFDLDKKGGKIKSEAGMMVNYESEIIEDRISPRKFYIDDTFVIFLKEKDKDLPYFAAKISDISSVQSEVKNILDEFYSKEITKNYKDIRELDEDYNTEQAQKDNSFVIGAMVHNDNLYSEFMENYKNKNDAFIRVSQNTVEGDIFIIDVLYDAVNDKIHLVKDNTRDGFSAQEDRTIEYKTYEKTGVWNYQNAEYWVAYNGELPDGTNAEYNINSDELFIIATIN